MERIKTLFFNALATYALLAVGHALWQLGADAVEHFRKHPSSS